MIDVFESITPDQTDDEAEKPTLPTGSRNRIEAQQHRRYGSAQECSNGVPSLLVAPMPDGDLRQFCPCRHCWVLPSIYYKAEFPGTLKITLGEFCFDQEIPQSQINVRSIKSAIDERDAGFVPETH
jgi:hypothetical protein